MPTSCDEFELREEKKGVQSAVFVMFAAVFVFIPVWWYTTDIYRAPLPYSLIQSLMNAQIVVPFQIFLDFDVSISSEEQEELTSFIQFELSMSKTDQTYIKFQYDVVDASSVDSLYTIKLQKTADNSCHVTIHIDEFISANICSNPEETSVLVSNAVKNIISREQQLVSAYTTIIQNAREPPSNRSYRFFTSYDLIFTLLNYDPDSRPLDWNIEEAIIEVLDPVLQKFAPFANFTWFAQMVYQIPLGINAKELQSGEKYYELKDLPHLLHVIESKLGRAMGTGKQLNFLTYVPSPIQAPLHIQKNDETFMQNAFYDDWGSLYILNLNDTNGQHHQLQCSTLIAHFTAQLKYHIGFPFANPSYTYTEYDAMEIYQWEFESVCRHRTIDNIAVAVSSVNGLATLVQQVKNMVIKDEISERVALALQQVNEALEHLSNHRLKNAAKVSNEARHNAELAFSDPSILALLYFQEDQKYAIYLPLFLPLAIPIFSSVGSILKYIKNIRAEKLKVE